MYLYVYLHAYNCNYIRTGFLINHFLSLVHPCDEANNGGCSQICNKRNEKHECSCESGFILEEDKATCQKGWLTYMRFDHAYVHICTNE